ncbi:YceI family protein [Pseudidiomarina sp. 1APP75-32.1]|uniref:YceI family protein n=1 Tax=Pseudidiomarina terrestris TaxID=2820060 RepID=A0AAW7QZ48_9GAMM|nr:MULTISPECIES: YceI family protein [unclassified Pseudidiomarina]MDN7124707.1 YceI family protein [Pseudidiomarina sp. 1APP75-32.1]MDN7125764.1 YceI family protein [Pseudidiomarina sp. 1APR75-33.1]MDN7129819.1 YceI family protein [Pseudidiomarina sp. 1APR75-15]MDN7137924.1 YceI family protein [Pseudidiomarina sp. 1ASP75-14]
MKKLLLAAAVSAALSGALGQAQAADYAIDIEGQHAFIQFKISHLGYSYLLGEFTDFDGSFSYDESNPGAASVQVTIDTSSIDSNHAERDKHLRSDDFLAVDEYPQARFVSTSYTPNGDGTGTLAGDLTLRGVTQPIEIAVNEIGAGPDPWGGFRRGFEGKVTLTPANFGFDYDLGPAAETLDMYLSIEGIRQ